MRKQFRYPKEEQVLESHLKYKINYGFFCVYWKCRAGSLKEYFQVPVLSDLSGHMENLSRQFQQSIKNNWYLTWFDLQLILFITENCMSVCVCLQSSVDSKNSSFLCSFPVRLPLSGAWNLVCPLQPQWYCRMQGLPWQLHLI